MLRADGRGGKQASEVPGVCRHMRMGWLEVGDGHSIYWEICGQS